jgi:hypothetical protein
MANDGRSKADIPYYVKGLALGVPAYLIGVHLWTWIFTASTFLAGAADFRQLYTAGHMIRSGQRLVLYDYVAQFQAQNAFVGSRAVALPFNHPAYEALFFLPFSLLSYRNAYLCFLAVNGGVLVLVYFLLRRSMGNIRRIYPWLPAALFVSFLPIAAALIQGQDSIVLLGLLAVSMTLLDRGWETMAGAALGLGLFKFQIVVPIACLFLVWRRWRLFAGFAAAAGVAALLSIAIAGTAGTFGYVRSLLSMSMLSTPDSLLIYRINPAAMPNLRGFVYGLAATHIPHWAMQTVIVADSLALFVWVSFAGREQQKAADNFALAVTAGVVLSYHLLIHDASILLIPITLTLNRFIAAEATGERNGRWAARISALAFVSPLCESFIPNHLYLIFLPVAALLFVLTRWSVESTAHWPALRS